jgi:hypothetical protein
MSRPLTLGAAALLAVASVVFSHHHLISLGCAVLSLVAVAISAWDVETALGILVVYLPFRTLASYLVPLPLRFVADAVVFVLLARLLLLHPDDILPVNPTEVLLIAFAGVGLILTVHAHAHLSGAILELRDLLLFPLLYAVVRRLRKVGDGPGPDWWERFLPMGLASIGVVGLQGLIGVIWVHHPYLVPPHLQQIQSRISAANAGRPYGWLDNPNVFGELGFFALVLTYYHFRTHRFRPVIPFVFLSVLFAAMVLFSFSRSAYLVLILGTVVLAAAVPGRLEKAAVVSACVVILGSALITPTGRARTLGTVAAASPRTSAPASTHRAHPRTHPRVRARHRVKGLGHHRRRHVSGLSPLSKSYLKASAKAGRLRTLIDAYHLLRRYPLGTGLGTFGSSGSKVFGTTLARMGINRTFYADDNYAVILVETGAPGFLLFLLAGLSVYLLLIRTRVAPLDRTLLWVLFLSITLLAATGDTWEQLSLTLYPWLALAVLLRPEEGDLTGNAARPA